MYVNYVPVSADGVIQAHPGAFYGLVCIASSSGSITLYDHASAASGSKIYEKALSAGDVVHFGGAGISFRNGLYADISNTITVNVLTAS